MGIFVECGCGESVVKGTKEETENPIEQSRRYLKIILIIPAYKLKAKRSIGGKLPQGATFQVLVENGKELNAKKICAAVNAQFGLDFPESYCYVSNFEVTKL